MSTSKPQIFTQAKPIYIQNVLDRQSITRLNQVLLVMKVIIYIIYTPEAE